MYQITINSVQRNVEELRFVRLKKTTNTWIQTDEENAEAIAVDSKLYNLVGKTPIQVKTYEGVGEPDENGIYEEYKEVLVTPPICYIVKIPS